jgi:hypothetical protein
MKKIAISKAQKRFNKAERCLATALKAASFEAFQDAWTDFLLSANAIHDILESGARGNPQTQQWFGGKKKERGKDPLLSYLHQARNSEEHGLAPVTALQARGWSIEDGGGGLRIHSLEADDRGNISGLVSPAPGAAAPIAKHWPSSIHLAVVQDDRFKTKFAPPTHHLGEELKDSSPATVGDAWMVYLKLFLDEAETYVI